MRRAGLVIAAWAVVAAFAAGPAVGHGQGSGPQPRTARVGVPGVANANPTMAAEGNFVAVAWGASATGGGADVYVAVSRDGGSTFGPPVRANREPGEARLGAERPPVVALVPEPAGSRTSRSCGPPGEPTPPIKVARSSDQGRTFGTPRDVQASGARGNRGWASMAADRNGNLHVVWLDHRDAVAMSPNAAASTSTTASRWPSNPASTMRGSAAVVERRAACGPGRVLLLQDGRGNRLRRPGSRRLAARVSPATCAISPPPFPRTGAERSRLPSGSAKTAGRSTAAPKTGPAWPSTRARRPTWRGPPSSAGGNRRVPFSTHPWAVAACSLPACGCLRSPARIPSTCSWFDPRAARWSFRGTRSSTESAPLCRRTYG